MMMIFSSIISSGYFETESLRVAGNIQYVDSLDGGDQTRWQKIGRIESFEFGMFDTDSHVYRESRTLQS